MQVMRYILIVFLISGCKMLGDGAAEVDSGAASRPVMCIPEKKGASEWFAEGVKERNTSNQRKQEPWENALYVGSAKVNPNGSSATIQAKVFERTRLQQYLSEKVYGSSRSKGTETTSCFFEENNKKRSSAPELNAEVWERTFPCFYDVFPPERFNSEKSIASLSQDADYLNRVEREFNSLKGAISLTRTDYNSVAKELGKPEYDDPYERDDKNSESSQFDDTIQADDNEDQLRDIEMYCRSTSSDPAQVFYSKTESGLVYACSRLAGGGGFSTYHFVNVDDFPNYPIREDVYKCESTRTVINQNSGPSVKETSYQCDGGLPAEPAAFPLRMQYQMALKVQEVMRSKVADRDRRVSLNVWDMIVSGLKLDYKSDAKSSVSQKVYMNQPARVNMKNSSSREASFKFLSDRVWDLEVRYMGDSTDSSDDSFRKAKAIGEEIEDEVKGLPKVAIAIQFPSRNTTRKPVALIIGQFKEEPSTAEGGPVRWEGDELFDFKDGEADRDGNVPATRITETILPVPDRKVKCR